MFKLVIGKPHQIVKMTTFQILPRSLKHPNQTILNKKFHNSNQCYPQTTSVYFSQSNPIHHCISLRFFVIFDCDMNWVGGDYGYWTYQ